MSIVKKHSNTFSYDDISYKLNVWDKMNYFFLKTFDKPKVEKFVFSHILKQSISNLNNKFPNLYNEELKALDFGFAEMLYTLLENAFKFQVLFDKAAFYNIPRNVDHETPLFDEYLFHIFYQKKPAHNYPFNFDNFTADININDKDNISNIKTKKLQTYFNAISEQDIYRINLDYKEFVSLKEIYNTYLIEFIRRFNPYVSFHNKQDEPTPTAWKSVTLSAVTHYLEELLTWLYHTTLRSDYTDQEYLQTLNLINEALTVYTNGAPLLTPYEIKTAWTNICIVVEKLVKYNILEQLLQIAHQDPTLSYKDLPQEIPDFYQQFQQTITDRIDSLSPILFTKIVSNDVEQKQEVIAKKFKVQVEEIGIYTKNNREKLLALAIDPFQYTELISLINIWMEMFVNKFIKDTVMYLISNQLFSHHSYTDKFNTIYKKIIRFNSEFNLFVNYVSEEKESNKKMTHQLLDSKISDGGRHIIKTTAHIINIQADLLVKDFKNIYLTIHKFADDLLGDLENKSNFLIKNTNMIKKDLPKLDAKLKILLEFDHLFSTIINLVDIKTR